MSSDSSGDPTRSCGDVERGSDVTFKVRVCAKDCLEGQQDTLLNIPTFGQLAVQVRTLA